MQHEYKCIFHEGQGLQEVCLQSECQQRVLCAQCLADHPHKGHQIQFKEFQKHFASYTYIYKENMNSIKKTFKNLYEAFNICIKRAEQRTLKQFNNITPELLNLEMKDLQSQQLYGVVDAFTKSEEFQQILAGLNPYKITKYYSERLPQIQTQILNLQSEIIILINRYAASIKNFAPISKILKSQIENPLQINNFRFSNEYKNQLLTIQKQGLTIKRTGNRKNGLSIYALVNTPLSKNNHISFRITNQYQLFMYFGVCDRESFKLHNFEGPVYEKGRGMYAIRQNQERGKNAITLHNSLDNYSNKQAVPWGIRAGQILTMSIQQERGKQNLQLVYEKQGGEKFILPLDKKTDQLYPFVGLKFKDDQIEIVQNFRSKMKMDIMNK